MNKISVIVPVYKVEKYLDRCVESIVNQTYKNLEIILIDDGSPDNSPQMCDEWAKKDKRIKVIHKQNAGVSGARNDGLKIATGDYISFVDSDDYVDKCMFEKMLMTIHKNNSDLAMCFYSNVYEDGKIENVYEKNLKLANGNNIFGFYILQNAIRKNNILETEYILAGVYRTLYKKELLRDRIFEPEVKFCEDFLFNSLVINSDTKIAFIEENLYFYFQRSNSAIHTISDNLLKSKLIYVKKILEVLKNKLKPNYYKAFKFTLYKMIYMDFIKSKDIFLYKKYYK